MALCGFIWLRYLDFRVLKFPLIMLPIDTFGMIIIHEMGIHMQLTGSMCGNILHLWWVCLNNLRFVYWLVVWNIFYFPQ
jgi:hypothetical protein